MSPPPQVPLRRTTLIILCEDGSLRIYVANTSSSTEFWLQPQFQPTSPLAVLRAHPCSKGRGVVKKAENLKFPIDFFEQCQLSNDVEVCVCVCVCVLRVKVREGGENRCD